MTDTEPPKSDKTRHLESPEEDAPNPKRRRVESQPGEATTQQIGDGIDLTQQTNVILDEALAKNEYPAFTPKHHSLMTKHVTREVFDELKGLTTPTGFTIARAINTGTLNDHSLVGIHAGDVESYSVFARAFDPIIQEYHGGYGPDGIHPTDMDVSRLERDILNKEIIKSTRIRVARNIAGFRLAPGQDTVEDKLAIEAIMKQVFDGLEGDLAGTYYPLDGMSEKDRKRLIEDHFLFKGQDKAQADSGYHRWWPRGRGIYHNDAKTFLCWLNEGDHIRIISMEKSGDVRSVFDRLCRGVAAIEAGLMKIHGQGWMRTDHLGMITCCPTNLGTGLRGGVHIHLPAFAALGLDRMQEIAIKHHLQARGIHGEHSQSEGGIVDLSNKYRLGYSEVQLVQFMIDGVNAITEHNSKL